MIAHLYLNTKPFEAEMSRENSLKMLSFATNNDAIFEMFFALAPFSCRDVTMAGELGLAELTRSSHSWSPLTKTRAGSGKEIGFELTCLH